MDNYTKIIQNNLNKFYGNLTNDRVRAISGEQYGSELVFRAFGEECRVTPDAITLGQEVQTGPVGIVITLYVLEARNVPCVLEPLKSFKEFNDSMPYVGAFSTHSENILIPQVDKIEKYMNQIIAPMAGRPGPSSVSGDFSFIVFPLPKIALCYIFYRQDEDFPASVTCLFSHNASAFLPVDGLADVAEYTSKKLLMSVQMSFSP